MNLLERIKAAVSQNADSRLGRGNYEFDEEHSSSHLSPVTCPNGYKVRDGAYESFIVYPGDDKVPEALREYRAVYIACDPDSPIEVFTGKPSIKTLNEAGARMLKRRCKKNCTKEKCLYGEEY